MANSKIIQSLSGISLHDLTSQKDTLEAFAKMWTIYTGGSLPTQKQDEDGTIRKALIEAAKSSVEGARSANVNCMVVIGCRGDKCEAFGLIQPVADLFSRSLVLVNRFYCQDDYSEGGLADQQLQILIGTWRNSSKFKKKSGSHTVFKLKVSTQPDAMEFAKRHGFKMKYPAIHAEDFHEYERILKHD